MVGLRRRVVVAVGAAVGAAVAPMVRLNNELNLNDI